MSSVALLVNLGSPESTSIQDVRKYLNEFLMDPYVIDLPWIIRRIIVSLFVLPKRPTQSAKAYRSVWTKHGSPLITISYQLLNKVRQHCNMPVELAMRYSKPGIKSTILKIMKQYKPKKLVLFPLYPHYAMSTVKTVIEKTQEVISQHHLDLKLEILPCFYKHKDYIDALIQSTTPYLSKPFDHLIFSYHGLPERHLKKDDPTKNHCLKSSKCCHRNNLAHLTCYRHQVHQTTWHFVQAIGLPKEKYSIAFQSKLGRDQWLEPSTENTLISLAKNGVKRVLVICPAFVSDCLETLEEIAIAGKKTFIKAGGEDLELVPCLNDNDQWVKIVAAWLNNY